MTCKTFPRVLVYFMLCFSNRFICGDQELWKKDMTDEIYIENSNEGFQHVNLTCSKSLVSFAIKMDVDEFGNFDGVVYTRGSFSSAKPPCFYDATGADHENVKLEFQPTECHLEKADVIGATNYTNVVVIQHDDFLIFPGDLAFEISCKMSEDGERYSSSIGLADPDPSAKELPKHRKSTVTTDTGFVQFVPDDIRPRKKKTSSGSKSQKTNPKDNSKKKSKEKRLKKKGTVTKIEL